MPKAKFTKSDNLLTIVGVKAQIKNIKDNYDPESRHNAEDVLNESFIKGIARGWYSMVNALAISKQLSKLIDLGLDRWYA